MVQDSIKRSLCPGGSIFKDAIGSLCALAIGLYSTLIPFIINPRFFFNDDEQNQHYPYFIDIGQHLRHHQWPGVTLSTLYGANLIDDWQYALFNPFSLLLYWIICPLQNLLFVGLLVIGIYLTFLSLGGYWLGRVFGLSRIYSLTVAVCLVTNNFIQYMFCDSWATGLISLTWFIWAWVLLEQYRKEGQTIILGALACVIYLTITSGFPHTMLMLGLLMLAYFLELVLLQKSMKRAVKLVLVNIGALLATAPFLLPALLSFSWMHRPAGIQSSGMFMPDLGSVLNLSAAFYCPRIHLFWHEYPYYPMMYLGWFIVPLLPLFSWQTAFGTLQKRLGLIIFGLIATILLFGPESIGPIRWPIRFLPFIHVTVLLAFFLVISTPGIFRISKPRLALVLAILFFQFFSSFSVFPSSLQLQLIGAGSLAVMVLIAVRFIHCRNFRPLGLLFLCGMVIFFPLTHLVTPQNVDLGDSLAPIQNDAANPTIAHPFSGYELYLGPHANLHQKNVYLAAEGIPAGAYTVNGYSSLEHVGLQPRTHGHVWMEVPDPVGAEFFVSPEPITGKPRVDLMRVNRLLVYNDYFEHLKPLLGDHWIPVLKGEEVTVLENRTPNQEPTTLSFASDGIEVKPQGEVTGEEEHLQITSNPSGGYLVFARLYWPGFEAKLDNKPLPLKPLDNLLVRVDLPPGAQGRFQLSFEPPGYKLSLFLAAAGIALCCVGLAIRGRENNI